MSKLKIGIIVDDEDQSFLNFDLYCRSLNSIHYSIEAIIVQQTFRSSDTGKLKKLSNFIKRRGIWRLLHRTTFFIVKNIEYGFVNNIQKYKEIFLTHSLSEFKVKKFYVDPIVSDSGLVYRYKNEHISLIKKMGLDLLIRGGSGILRGEILEACPFGVISFHHANNDVNRGGPPGFWEVFNREPSTGFVIQRLLDELDGGDVIFRGSIPTSFFYMKNFCKITYKSSVFMHKAIERIAVDGGIKNIHPKIPYAYPLYTTPTIAELLQYVIKTFSYGLKKLIGRLNGNYYRWGVAYQFINDWRCATLWKSKEIKNPPHRFLADPFVVSKEGLRIIYVEDYDYRTSKGKISAYEISKYGYKELGVAIEEDFHLSYPSIFQDGDDLYMTPEAHKAGDIRIYKCLHFPLRWELHAILMKNISAADTSIFKFEGKYWMITNIDSAGLDDHDSELHLFYADSFDSINWTSHPMNPVIFDSRYARNGGLIIDNGDVYRVFQSQAFDMYGESMGIAKITTLTVNRYEEQLICHIPAKFIKGVKGAHTFSFCSGLMCFDFVKFQNLDN